MDGQTLFYRTLPVLLKKRRKKVKNDYECIKCSIKNRLSSKFRCAILGGTSPADPHWIRTFCGNYLILLTAGDGITKDD